MAKVSVVMPVYNGEKYIGEAVESILNQTFTDFELIIVDDCSTDTTPAILEGFTDSRIHVHRHRQNQGVAIALNTGWQRASTPYVAIMHADDISLPERLAKQYEFLEQNPSTGILGCSVQLIDPAGNYLKQLDLESSAALVGWELYFMCPLVHPAVMLRRTVLEIVEGYCPEMRSEEDYDLWSRASDHTQIASIPDTLLQYRTWPGSATSQHPERMERNSIKIVQQTVSRHLNQTITIDEASFLRRLVGSWAGNAPKSRTDIQRVARILDSLYDYYLSSAAFSVSEKRALALNVALKFVVLCQLSLRIAPEQSLLFAIKALRLNPAVVPAVVRVLLNKAR